MWASGIAAGVAVVSLWKVARSGFVLLGAGVAALIGVLGVAAGAGVPGWVAIGVMLIAVPLRKTRWAALAIGLAAILWIWPASEPWGLGVAAAGALALGGITSEMLLGHWYLVDPKLPRWPLRRLAIVGVVGISIDAIVIRLVGREAGPVPSVLLIGLAITTVLLMVAVWFSLKGRSYTGVMAATGLSYLATLTALGAVVLGRANAP
jgi:hypothetical protein